MKFTVFTPTYNRAHLLHRPYESLLEQTCKDFEWLVVDDGSTDNTEYVIEHLRKCVGRAFPIRYLINIQNKGKHIAHNQAASVAKGDLFAILDSDDALTPFALESCWKWWGTVDRGEFAGVEGLAMYPDGTPTSKPYPRSPLDATYQELRYIHKMRGERWGVLRTDLARAYPFPALPGFVPEGLVWGQLRKKFRAVNEVYRVYYA